MTNFINNLPGGSYENLKKLYAENEINFKMERNTAYDIASSKAKIVSLLPTIYMLLPICVLIIISIIVKNYWLLLLIPVIYVLSLFIHRLKVLSWLSIVGVLAGLIFNVSLEVLVFPITIVILSIGYFIWWEVTSSIFVNMLLQSEALFNQLWNNQKIMLTDNKGNVYINNQ